MLVHVNEASALLSLSLLRARPTLSFNSRSWPRTFQPLLRLETPVLLPTEKALHHQGHFLVFKVGYKASGTVVKKLAASEGRGTSLGIRKAQANFLGAAAEDGAAAAVRLEG